ncbi:MAG: carboxymuconolactone decarboxylase family protein [Solirubrobacteraceae bacterium]
MPPSAEAQKNHDELFPGHVSTLKVTDPELIEYFDNFAFDEVMRYGSLNTRTRLMVQLASLIACQALSEYRVMLGAALTVGVTTIEVKEIVYQAVLYVGMGKVFDVLHTTNDVLSDAASSCCSKTDRRPHLRPGRRRASRSRRRSSVATFVDQMYASVPEDEMHIRRTLSANCFGDHYTRTGIDIKTRELLTFAMLISLGGCG